MRADGAILKVLVGEILKAPHEWPWTAQGLGMLRTYLKPDRSMRLHIWDPCLRLPHVSTIHTHPWDFRSTVVAGWVRNKEYVEHETACVYPEHEYVSANIKCGFGGGLIEGSEKDTVLKFIFVTGDHLIEEGEYYQLDSDVIHESCPAPGTVTVVEKTRIQGDGETSRVFWRKGENFVSGAWPATHEEIDRACKMALDTWWKDGVSHV